MFYQKIKVHWWLALIARKILLLATSANHDFRLNFFLATSANHDFCRRFWSLRLVPTSIGAKFFSLRLVPTTIGANFFSLRLVPTTIGAKFFSLRLGFVLAHMVKNKGSLTETFETGTNVIDPSDHENDV